MTLEADSPERSGRGDTARWVSFVLFSAAAYNLLWGAAAVLLPVRMLGFLGVAAEHAIFWQCIGMFVALYGIGYGFASVSPARYWPFVLVGLLGKVLGPVGAGVAVASGRLPARFLWVNATNDLLWWGPFAWVLWVVWRRGDRLAGAAPPGSGGSLYRRVLGADFEDLTPRIRRFHASEAPIEVRGSFRARRGRSWIGNRLTDLAGFPRSAEALAVSLRVVPHAGGETWRRHFGGTRVESSQYRSRGQLVERFGPLVMYLDPRVVSGALVVRDTRSTLFGVPLPPFLTPRVEAGGIDAGEGIEVRVEITCSPFGLLVEYSGEVRLAGPDPQTAA